MIAYAFDMQGTLVSYDLQLPRPEIISIARALFVAGHPVFVVSSCNIDNKGNPKAMALVAGLVERFDIPATGVHLAYYDNGDEPTRLYRAGQSKAAKMRELRATVMFDDIAEIRRAIMDDGLVAIGV